MKAIISWSGESSLAVAEALRDWLPKVVQAVRPWLSQEDIRKGARWRSEITRQLEASYVGIICLTDENLRAPWVNFEAGALATSGQRSLICTYLFGISPADVEEPLAQFQATVANREDTLKLVLDINALLGPQSLSERHLEEIFKLLWPTLEKALAAVPKQSGPSKTERADREILEELLGLVRGLVRERTTDQQEQRERSALASVLDPTLLGEGFTSGSLRTMTDEELENLFRSVISRRGSGAMALHVLSKLEDERRIRKRRKQGKTTQPSGKEP